MFCVKCGTEYEGKFCPNCGEPAPKKRFCPKCGAEVSDPKQTTCDQCGAHVPAVEDAPSKKEEPAAQPNIVINNTNSNVNTIITGKPKNKWVAFFLCLFLGMFGAHKFYEGRIGMGVVYLLTIGLLGIGWLVDCVLLFLKPNPYYV